VFLAGEFSSETIYKAMAMGLTIMWRERLNVTLGLDRNDFVVDWLDIHSARYAQLNPRLGFQAGGVSVALARLDGQGNPTAVVLRRGPFDLRVDTMLDNPELGQLMDAGDEAVGRLARALGRPMPLAGVYVLNPKDVDQAEARRFRLRRFGAVVYHVTSLSSAFLGGLQEGDQIVQVNRRPVRGVKDYVNALRRVNAVGKTMRVAFWRAGQVHRAAFKIQAYP
jgi:hypothetical protein